MRKENTAMFREMRRKKQLLTQEESEQILREARTAMLALAGDDNYPYVVPINYAYVDGKIYFHGAKSGHKIDAILRNDKVSLCVVQHDELVPEKLTTYFRSVTVFGRARILEKDDEKLAAAQKFGMRFYPDKEKVDNEIRHEWAALCVVEITIEHITGKEAKELALARKGEE